MTKTDFLTRVKRFLFVFVLCFNLIFIGVCAFYLLKFWPVLKNLRESHFKIVRTIDISIDSVIPVSARIDSLLTVPLNEDLEFSIPVKSILKVPIDDTLSVPITSPIHIEIDHTFHVEKDVYVQSELPLDQTIEAEVLGVKTNIPIKTNIPVELTFPLNENIRIKEQLSLNATEPVDCDLNKIIDVPVDFILNGTFPLKEELSIPLKADLPTEVTISGKMPVVIELDFMEILLDLKNGN